MEKEIKLVYKGKRLNGEKLVHAYQTEFSTAEMLFAKPIGKGAVWYNIGDTVVCFDKPNGVKGPYSVIRGTHSKSIRQWEIEELADEQTKKQIQASKIKPDGSVEALIKTIKEHTPWQKRRAVALYIYGQLL